MVNAVHSSSRVASKGPCKPDASIWQSEELNHITEASPLRLERTCSPKISACAPKASSPKSAPCTERPGIRHNQVYLVAASRLMCYFTRSQLGAVLPFLIKDLGLNRVSQGVLMSRYASGYILTQVVGGIVSDKLGGYVVLAALILATSACCHMVPLLSASSVEVFGAPFFFMGLCQGAVMPAGQVLISRWCLPSERSWASAVTGIGACIGTLALNLVAAPIASRFGWQALFHFTSLLCLGYLLLWLRYAASSPDRCSNLTHDEKALLQRENMLEAIPGKMSPGLKSSAPFLNLNLFLQVPVWTVFIAHLTQNSQVYFADWLTLFYSDYLGTSPDLISLCLAVGAMVELPARAATKSIPDHLAKNGYTLLRCRKWMSVQGFTYHLILCGAFGLLMVFEVKSIVAFTLIFALCRVAQAFHSGGYFANYLDLTQAHVGLLTGVGNTLASFAGIIVPHFIAEQLQIDSTNWLPIATAGVFINVIAIVWVSLGMSASCLDEAPPFFARWLQSNGMGEDKKPNS